MMTNAAWIIFGFWCLTVGLCIHAQLGWFRSMRRESELHERFIGLANAFGTLTDLYLAPRDGHGGD